MLSIHDFQDVLHDDVERTLAGETNEETVGAWIFKARLDHVEAGGEGLCGSPGAVKRLVPGGIIDELALFDECAVFYDLERALGMRSFERVVYELIQ